MAMDPSGSREALPSNVTATFTAPVFAGPASATGAWFGSDVDVDDVVELLVEVDDVVGLVVDVDDVVGRLVELDVELLEEVDDEVLLDVLVDDVDELVEVVFPCCLGCVVVDVDEVDVVVGRLVDVEDVVGRLVEVDVELLVEVEDDVELLVEVEDDVELLVEVEDDVEVLVVVDVVVGFAARAGTAKTSTSRTLPRTFPPG